MGLRSTVDDARVACQPKPRAQRALDLPTEAASAASARLANRSRERSEREAKVGGEGGIRTPVPVTRQDAFEAPPLRPLRYLSLTSLGGAPLTFPTSLRARGDAPRRFPSALACGRRRF